LSLKKKFSPNILKEISFDMQHFPIMVLREFMVTV
jgi:hypothetical protein